MIRSILRTLCEKVAEISKARGAVCETVDLREHALLACTGCGRCFDTERCCNDRAFNQIYGKAIQADALFIVSPHYAPVPAKLCMLLEKMEELRFSTGGKTVRIKLRHMDCLRESSPMEADRIGRWKAIRQW